jgi:Flp pilus assembly protein TadB
MQQARDDRSLGELFSELSRQTSTLFRQEFALAKTEMSQKASKAGKDVASIAVGGAVAYAGFLAIVAGVILLLAEVVDWWLSALIVGVAVGLIGYLLIQRGLAALKSESIAPKQTIESLKEDAEWAKQQTT